MSDGKRKRVRVTDIIPGDLVVVVDSDDVAVNMHAVVAQVVEPAVGVYFLDNTPAEEEVLVPYGVHQLARVFPIKVHVGPYDAAGGRIVKAADRENLFQFNSLDPVSSAEAANAVKQLAALLASIGDHKFFVMAHVVDGDFRFSPKTVDLPPEELW